MIIAFTVGFTNRSGRSGHEDEHVRPDQEDADAEREPRRADDRRPHRQEAV